ncbi:MAG: malonyl-CoA/methylmalonyl-CoA synthetase [Acidobacteriota bacterium]|jgi:malonyl-CoA/methylmalonyl-CoA synthetase|nr:malonyl-CoA/methylmalonyl-CoA synthetase [Acidobacteriota bacterium]
MNLHDLFAIPCLRAPGKAALLAEVPGTGPVELTYGDLFDRARRLAAGLAGRGIRKGDRVAFFLGNRPEFVAAYLAVLALGAVVVPINLAYRRREIAHMLSDAEPRLLLTEESQLPVLAELAPEERGSVEVILAGDFDRLAGDPARRVSTVIDGDDLALLLYTSGTTGRSKGAMISHANVLATVTDLLAAWAWEREDVLLLTLPLFHTHGLIVGLTTALAAGATVRLHPRFEAGRAAADLAGLGGTSGPTLFFGVPTMYVRLVEELRRTEVGPTLGPALGRLRLFCSGSAPLSPETFAAFRDLTGHAILERYGMTETGMNLSNPYAGPRVPGQVGTPLPGVSIRVVDREGSDLPPGSEGDLLVAGSNVFSGYWRAPAKTAESFVHDDLGRRWFKTGDLAKRDPETGAVTLLGRSSELILTGGFNVYPREVEEVLATYPGVREAAVVGRPHPEWGEVPVAYLVAEGEIAEGELVAYLKGQLAGFKVPRTFHYVEVLPRNALGKVQKHLL